MTPEQLKRVQEALEMCRREIEPLMDDLHEHFNLPPDALQMAMCVSPFDKPGFVATDIDDPVECARVLAEAAETILAAVNPGAVAREHFRQDVPPHVHELTKEAHT